MSEWHKIEAIHQILLVTNGESPSCLPPQINKSGEMARALYPDATYKLWTGEAIEALLQDHMQPEVIKAYHALRPLAYKADLARYVILYIYGGLYVDLGVLLQRYWHIPIHRKIAACRDLAFVSPSWTAIQNGLIWAKPGRHELRYAIDKIVEHCRNKYYGSNPLCPTGPVVLGHGFVASTLYEGFGVAVSEQDIGSCKAITPEGSVDNLAYFSGEEELIALRAKKVAGDLSHLGIKNGNNYNHLWTTRGVYLEKVESAVVAHWPASGPDVRATLGETQSSKGIAITTATTGRICFGPYVTLPAGKYILRVYFGGRSKFRRLKLEISVGHEHRTLHRLIRYKKFLFQERLC